MSKPELRTGTRVDKTASRRTVADFLEAVLADYPEGSGTRKNHEVYKRKNRGALAGWCEHTDFQCRKNLAEYCEFGSIRTVC